MNTKTLQTRDDVTEHIARLCGFDPTESVVVLGTGTDPIARVDTYDWLTGQVFKNPKMLWQEPVVIVLYDHEDLLPVVSLMARSQLPDVEVMDVFVTDRRVLGWTRAEMEADEWSQPGDKVTAEREAMNAWCRGQGARARMLREIATVDGDTGMMDWLAAQMRTESDPRLLTREESP